MTSISSRKPRKLAYTIPEFCKLAAISRGKIYAELGAGRLIARKCGSRTIILHGDAISWLKALPLYHDPAIKPGETGVSL